MKPKYIMTHHIGGSDLFPLQQVIGQALLLGLTY